MGGLEPGTTAGLSMKPRSQSDVAFVAVSKVDRDDPTLKDRPFAASGCASTWSFAGPLSNTHSSSVEPPLVKTAGVTALPRVASHTRGVAAPTYGPARFDAVAAPMH